MYSPELREELVKRVYLMAKEKDVTMTKIVNDAVERVVTCYEALKKINDLRKEEAVNSSI